MTIILYLNGKLEYYKIIYLTNTKLKRDSIWIYLEELIPEQMVEYGEILPKSGKEKKWLKSLPKELNRKLLKIDKKQMSTLVAEELAKKAKDMKITKVYFDRGSYKYHGRVKLLADELRKNGMEF